MMRLEGYDAINYAVTHDRQLSKYADPIEDGREDLTAEEARAIAREDARLIYLDVTGEHIVYDPITDARETSDIALIAPIGAPDATSEITAAIRALYDHPSARAYSEGSYAVSL